MDYILETKQVCKGFGPAWQRTSVLHNINLQIERGEFVALVGYSGTGKTTLISLLAGLQRPDRGTVYFQGQELREPGTDLGVVFQTYSLLPWKTVFGNIYLAVEQILPQWTRDQKIDYTERFISLVNLTAARNKKPAELSGGMRQRVALARALALDPEVLLMDEPMSALDALTRGSLQEEIVRIWEKKRKTIVMITNDVDEAILMADRIIPMSAGPDATLGPSIPIDLPRPRDKKAVNRDVRYQRIRNDVIHYLLTQGKRREKAVANAGKTLPVPILEVSA